MSALSTNIITAITAHLEALKTAQVLKAYLVQDFRENLLEKDLPAYPCAILMPPAVDSVEESRQTNLRTFTFDLVVVQKKDNLSGANAIGELIEAIIDEFDNDPTLGGAADGGLPPGSSVPDEVTSADGTFIVFAVTLRPRALKNLTF